MGSRVISENRRSRTEYVTGCGGGLGKGHRILAWTRLKKRSVRATWNALQCLNIDTIFKPKSIINVC